MNPVLALIIANIIWGTAYPNFKFALQNIPPFTLAFIRFFFASLIFVPFVINRWQPLTVRQWIEIILVGFFGVTINISFFFLGLGKTESINAPIIASSGPIFIYLLSVQFLKEKPKLKVFSGMLVGLLGVLIIILSPIFLGQKKLIFGEIQGNLFFLLATLGTVFQTIVGKDVLRKINSFQVTLLSFLFGSLTFLPFMKNELIGWSFTNLDIRGIVGIIFGIFLSSALAYYLYYWGISKIKAQEVGLFTYIDPVIAVLIAIPLLGEYPNLYFFIGSIFVFGGIFLAEGRIHWHPFHKLRKS